MERFLKISVAALILVVMGSNSTLSGQRVFREGSPDGIEGIDLSDEWFEIAFDGRIIDSLVSAANSNRNPYRFALSEQVAVKPQNSGLLFSKGDETVWYMPVRSEGARSLNIILDRFRLSAGESLYVYDPALRVVRGPFTSMNNNNNGVLAILPVPGKN
ncbi:MAG: hypothetical protein R2744_00680 [Bacteroidales bacterium]